MLRAYVTDPDTSVETEYTVILRPDKKFELGVRASNGEADQGDILLDDAGGTLDWAAGFPGGRSVRVTEDESGSELTIFLGRIAPKNMERGTFAAASGRELTLTVEDANADLTGIIVHGYARPEETGRARVLALRLAYLNGASSTALNSEGDPFCRDSTVIGAAYVENAGNVTMPAKTYDATDPLGVIRECAEWEGKRAFVYTETDGTRNLYYAPKDSTTYLNCTLAVSDNPAEVDNATIFGPHWVAGPALSVDPSERITGALLIHPDTTLTYERRLAAEAVSDRWELPVYSEFLEAIGVDELATILDQRDVEEYRYQFGISLSGVQLHLVRAGMRIEVKRARAAGIGSSTFARIAQIRYTWLAPTSDGNQFLVIVYLENPIKGVRRFGLGSRPSTTPVTPIPVTPTDPGDGGAGCPADVCQVVPAAWIQAPTAGPGDTDMVTIFTDGAIDASVVVGEDLVEGIYYQTDGSMFPPLVSGEGQMRGAVILPVLDATVYGAEIKIKIVDPASGSPHGAGLSLIQANGAGGSPFNSVEVVGQALDPNLWLAGGSSKVTYLAPMSGIYKYAIRYCDGETWIKLWPGGVEEPATWYGPGNTAVPDEVRIIINVVGSNFSDDFTWHFTRPTWCTGDGQPAYYYQWTAATYIETADGSTATFFLPLDPPGGVAGLNAFVNGVYEPSTFDSVARSFTLAFAPDEGDIVDAAWIPIP